MAWPVLDPFLAPRLSRSPLGTCNPPQVSLPSPLRNLLLGRKADEPKGRLRRKLGRP